MMLRTSPAPGDTQCDQVVLLTLFWYNYRKSWGSSQACRSLIHSQVLTLDDEINLIWLRRWNAGAMLNTIARYLSVGVLLYDISFIRFNLSFTFVQILGSDKRFAQDFMYDFALFLVEKKLVLSVNRGEHSLETHVLFYIATIIVSSAIFLSQIRTYILYEKRKKVLTLFYAIDAVLLVILFICEAILVQLKSVTFRAPRDISKAHFTRVWYNITYFIVTWHKLLYLLFVRNGHGSNRSGIQNTPSNTHLMLMIVTLGIIAPNMLLHLKKQLDNPSQLPTGFSNESLSFHATVPQDLDGFELEDLGGSDSRNSDVELTDTRRCDSDLSVLMLRTNQKQHI
ncbi:hypothetical protein ACEPAI_4517 [Sanghuangporus weigelae]